MQCVWRSAVRRALWVRRRLSAGPVEELMPVAAPHRGLSHQDVAILRRELALRFPGTFASLAQHSGPLVRGQRTCENVISFMEKSIQTQDYDSVLKLWGEILKLGLEPPAQLVGHVAVAMRRHGLWRNLLELIEIAEGCRASSLTLYCEALVAVGPSRPELLDKVYLLAKTSGVCKNHSRLYATYIHQLLQSKQKEKALQVFEDCLNDQVELQFFAYDVAIRDLLNDRDIPNALILKELMLKSGHHLTEGMLCGFIKTALELNDPEVALTSVQEMLSVLRIQPSETILKRLFQYFSVTASAEESMRVLEKFLIWGGQPTSKVCSLLSTQIFRERKTDLFNKLLKIMEAHNVPRNEKFYSELMVFHGSCRDPVKLRETWNLFVQSGEQLQDSSAFRVINACIQAHQLDLAAEAIDHWLRLKSPIDKEFPEQVLRKVVKIGEGETVIQIFEKFLNQGIHFSGYFLETFLLSLAKKGFLEDAFRGYQMVLQNRNPIEEELFKVGLVLLSRKNSVEAVEPVIQAMQLQFQNSKDMTEVCLNTAIFHLDADGYFLESALLIDCGLKLKLYDFISHISPGRFLLKRKLYPIPCPFAHLGHFMTSFIRYILTKWKSGELGPQIPYLKFEFCQPEIEFAQILHLIRVPLGFSIERRGVHLIIKEAPVAPDIFSL